MKSRILLGVLSVLVIGLLAVRESRLARRVQALDLERSQWVAERETVASRLEAMESVVRQQEGRANVTTAFVPASPPGVPLSSAERVAALESRVARIEHRTVAAIPSAPSVPEYDPAQPPPPEEPIPAVASPAQQKRGWGPEQVAGPPDTHQAGDISTAWASRSPDAGPEWLSANFDQPVELAEVRVRETYNPGAIAKVTAMVNGQEMTLWEGTAQGGSAPRDFVIRPSAGIQAQSVVVHLDTSRVPGWNEIDAVELVGRDGSRQWANSVSASSTYAEPGLGSLREVSTRFEETPTPNQFAPRRR